MHPLALLPLAQAALAVGPLFSIAIYSLVGIGLAILGYKLFDFCTPGNLTDEIVNKSNVAAAVVGAAVILGVCLIVAAAIVG
jgi:putative membrane protein